MVAWHRNVAPDATQHEVSPPEPHAVPAQSFMHDPQRVTLVMSASQPSHGSLSQSARPATQEGWQTALALQVFALTKAGEPEPVWQARPQAPQWLTLLTKFVSQPSQGSLSQSPRSAWHSGSQTPE